MLKTRVLAALVFAPSLAGLVYLGGRVLALSCVVLAVLMAWELLRMFLGDGDAYTKVVGLGLSALVAASVAELPYSVPPWVLVPLGSVLVFIAVLLRAEPIETAGRRVAVLALTALYCGALIPYLTRLRELPQGMGLALAALFCTWAADTGAYFAGRAFGRHKLYPKVSPGKTVEGLVGGIVASVAVAVLLPVVVELRMSMLQLVVIGAGAAILGALGDLFESMLKRSAGVKDSGALIPGHGGVLDRFDAAMFVFPALYVFAVLVSA